MYYNIHTHQIVTGGQACSIVNILFPEETVVRQAETVRYSIGIHPWRVNRDRLAADLNGLKKRLSGDPSLIAIGECGLDKACNIPLEWQKTAFEAQVLLSEELKMPVIIHCVKAIDEIVHYKRNLQPAQAWIVHGFRGKRRQMETLLQHGFFLSFGTVYNAEALKEMDTSRLFLETDDRPDPIQSVYKTVAASLHMPESELVKQIEENVSTVFYSLKK